MYSVAVIGAVVASLNTGAATAIPTAAAVGLDTGPSARTAVLRRRRALARTGFLGRSGGLSLRADETGDQDHLSPSPAPAPVKAGLPSIPIMLGGAVHLCPTGQLMPLENQKRSMSEQECAQLVQANQVANRCGDLYVVKTKDGGDGAACSCCPPVPDVDCVNCLAGSQSVGWQTRPQTSKRAGFDVLKLAVHAPKSASCSQRALASWAAMAAYKDGMQDLGGRRQRDLNFFYMMQTAFFKNTGSWSPSNGTETDHSSLWIRKGECVLAFRGSDSYADFKNNLNQSPINYLGLSGIFQGMAQEFQAVLQAMNVGNALTLVRTTCSRSISVTGHGMGGAVAQLFAVLANKVGDPLKAGITVDSYYGFGAMPVGLTELTDEKHPEGCFPGGMYYNMQKDSSGNSFVDILSHQGVQNGYKWVRSAKILTWNYKTFEVVPCGTALKPGATPLGYAGLPARMPAPPVTGTHSQLALHDPTQYVDNVGCQDKSGLKAKTWPNFTAPPAGLVISGKSAISQCPKGQSISVFDDSLKGKMTPDACAQLVRKKKVQGICGNLYSVKVGADIAIAGMPAASSPTVCSCCQPAPPERSCVTCTAGSGNSGWETAPVLALHDNWVTMILADSPTKASTCGAAGAASWAAMAAYRDAPMMAVSLAYVSNFKFMLKSAFWTLKASWSAANTTGTERDYAELWFKGSDCMLAFRGSDSTADFENAKLLSAGGTYHGIALSSGVLIEWQAMLVRLQQDSAFSFIRAACPKPVTVVGHALGGALAQVFAAMANRIGDPLNMGLTAGSIYGFGAPPIGYGALGIGTEPVNDKRWNGCFDGGLYGNLRRLGDGKSVVDPEFTRGMALGLRHVKTAKYLTYNSTDKVVYQCGAEAKYQTTYAADTALMPLHDYSLYTSSAGC